MTKQSSYRFADYDEPWEEKKLGEVAELLNGRAYKQEELLEDGEYRVLRVGNFNTNDRWYYSDLQLEDSKYANYGDLLYLWATNFGPELWKEEKVIYHYHIWKISGYSNILDKYYFYTFLEKDKNRIKQNTNGSTMVHITKGMMEERVLTFPSLPEQTVIGSFFQDIDQLISLQQRKLEVLKEQKKTYLKLLFPAKGQKKPALRFAGFEDEWEQQKASEIFYSVSDKNHVDLPVLSASQEYGMVKRDEIGIDIKYDKASVKTYKRVKPGQFVIHLRSFQGGFAHSDIEGITSPAYTVLDFSRSNKHFDLFWKEVFTSQNFIKRLETVTYGIRDGRSISFSDFSSLKLQFPSLPEQETIGSFFQDLDKAITKQEEKVNQLKGSKQTLLRKMFI